MSSYERGVRPGGVAAREGSSSEPSQGNGIDKALLHRRLVQRKAKVAAPAGPEVQQAADRGVQGSGEPLPHLEAVQRSFGRHDVSGVKAHTGGAAAEAANAIGAEAYATGSAVAFRSAPDLHTAAHEAAHVVQQRAGVQLKGGVGEQGDAYERHADQVADLVVQGRSAERVLDRMAGGPPAGAVQRKIKVGDDEFDPEMDYVQGKWGFTPAEKSVYLMWLKDGIERAFTNKEALKVAIRTVAAQPFGTDVAKQYPGADEQVAIFKQALQAGYRVFDTAYTYETLEHLWRAVSELRIKREEITIIYKVKPADDEALEEHAQNLERGPQDPTTPIQVRRTRKDKVSSRLGHARGAMGGDHPDVLMLHDADDLEAATKTLHQLIAEVKLGRAKSIGVSNVNVVNLEILVGVAGQQGVRIAMVQNRASPYSPDDDVREYCRAHSIQYLAYGLGGSGQVGACAGVGDEGAGLPTQYLLARHDPRVKALAERSGISEGELLQAWALERGIMPVSFSSRPDQAKKNFERGAKPLPRQVSEELTAMFEKVSPAHTETVARLPEHLEPLKALYQSYPDPTAWYILDTLRRAPGGDALLNAAARAIAGGHDEPERRQRALKNFSLNLVRHVADIQSAIQRMQNERNDVIKSNKDRPRDEQQRVPVVPFDDWREHLVPAFRDLAAASETPEVFNLFLDWGKKNHLEGHTMGHALEKWDEIARDGQAEHERAQQPPQPVPVAQPVVETVEVAYGDEHLHDEYCLAFKEGACATLAKDDTVHVHFKPHLVVENKVKEKKLVLKPA